jgi:uncharacterized membrane protein
MAKTLKANSRFMRLRDAAAWALIAAYLALVVAFAWDPTPFAQVLAAIGIASAMVHAVFYYGWKDALVLLIICLIITFTMENIGVATGLPFGSYHFEVGAELPHIGRVPIILGPLWFGMGYFSWVVAGTLLDGADRNLYERFNIIVLPIVAAFVMTQWDLAMDPPSSTIAKAWIWHDGGAYFGVPLVNYLGWLLTSWLFYQAFALYLSRRRELSQQPKGQSHALRLAAILFYLCSGLAHVTPLLLHQSGEITDAAEHLWRLHDLRATTVLIMFFTMLFTSMLAGLRLARDEPRHS